jgi:hypothetical protein
MLPPTTSVVGRVEVETPRLPSRSTFYSMIATLPKSLQYWVVSRTRNQLLHGSLRSDKPGVRQDEELEFHFNKGQFVVENSLARFGPLRLYQPSKDPTRPEGQHPCRNYTSRDVITNE